MSGTSTWLEGTELSKAEVLEGLKEAIIKFDIDNIVALAENALKQDVSGKSVV